MSDRILTLFGEEFAPEPPKGPGKTRAKKKTEEKATDEIKEEDQQPEAGENAAIATVEEKEQEQQLPEPEPQIVSRSLLDPIPQPSEPETAAQPGLEEIAETILATEEEQPEPEIAEPEATRSALPEEKTFELPDDWKGDKNYYTIGEVADLFKVKTSHIRFWTNEFKLKVRTTRKGDRLYTPDQVRELKAIHHLVKERGFKISGAKAKLKAQNKMDVETVDLKQSLIQLRSKLVAIRSQLS